MEIQQKIDELGRTIEAFKKLNDERLQKIESKGYAPIDAVEKVDKANAEITKLQEEIKSLQTAMARGQHGGGNNTTTEKDEKKAQYKAAFQKWAKGQITDLELKSMSVDSDADGGFLVTPEMSAEIVQKVFESSPIRQLASIQTISSDSLEILEDIDQVGSGWVTEVGARTATATSQLKKISIPTHELYAAPQISQKLLDDAQMNVEAWLQGKIAAKMARDEATAFVSGDGMGKPKGFLKYAAGTSFGQIEQVNSGDAALVKGDGLINLKQALKEPYQAGAVWLMQRATVAAVRQLKDSQGRYLWEPSLQPNNPDMLLGKAIYLAADMDAVAGGNLPIAYGDFKQGYQIVDRIGIRVIRDVYTAKPYVMFYATKRVGGAVKNFEAIKLQKISA